MAKTAEVPKYVSRSMSVGDAVSEVWSELQSLAEEMREAYDNTPESLQQGGVGEMRGECADNLEALDEPDVPDWATGLSVTVSHRNPARPKKRPSRAYRRDQASGMLDAVVSDLRALADDEAELDKLARENPDRSRDDLESDLGDLADALESLRDEADAIDFPGMYG